jgi:ribose 5-phosphate isomerase RpiB
MKKVCIGSDHAGFSVKTSIVHWLTDKGYEVKEANQIVEAFLSTEFQGGRHLRRIQSIVSGLPNEQTV